jgi:hypothetical protein
MQMTLKQIGRMAESLSKRLPPGFFLHEYCKGEDLNFAIETKARCVIFPVHDPDAVMVRKTFETEIDRFLGDKACSSASPF